MGHSVRWRLHMDSTAGPPRPLGDQEICCQATKTETSIGGWKSSRRAKELKGRSLCTERRKHSFALHRADSAACRSSGQRLHDARATPAEVSRSSTPPAHRGMQGTIASSASLETS